MIFNRDNPSPVFLRHIAMYAQMHSEGHDRDLDNRLRPDQTFPGEELVKIKSSIKKVVDTLGCETMLDYGCGKGAYYYKPDPKDGLTIQEYIGLQPENIRLYEPAINELSAFPAGQFDVVVCNDVIEHIPTPDVFWVMEEIFSLAKKAVVLRISCHPARSKMPDGTNAHCTIRPKAYWLGICDYLCSKYYVSYVLETVEENPSGGFNITTSRKDRFGEHLINPVK